MTDTRNQHYRFLVGAALQTLQWGLHLMDDPRRLALRQVKP